MKRKERQRLRESLNDQCPMLCWLHFVIYVIPVYLSKVSLEKLEEDLKDHHLNDPIYVLISRVAMILSVPT